jgi:hypothetical protein
VSWVLVAWAVSLRQAINTIAPTRDKASDGSIGDPAHAAGVSGHNPDDTPGTSAERQDADSIPEVRAIDVDSDLRQPGLTMLKVIQAILGSPTERARLIYIIYNEVIWSASNDWQPRRYTGPNPHTQHAHFSGHPAADTNGSPWPSVLALGEDMDLTTQNLTDISNAVWGARSAEYYDTEGDGERQQRTRVDILHRAEESAQKAERDAALALAGVQELQARPTAPEIVINAAALQSVIDSAVTNALSNPTVIAAIATAVADEEHRRMQS